MHLSSSSAHSSMHPALPAWLQRNLVVTAMARNESLHFWVLVSVLVLPPLAFLLAVLVGVADLGQRAASLFNGVRA